MSGALPWSYVLRVTCGICGAVGEHDHGPDIPSRTRDLPDGWAYLSIRTHGVYVCGGESCQGALADWRQQRDEWTQARAAVYVETFGPRDTRVREVMDAWEAEHPAPVQPWSGR